MKLVHNWKKALEMRSIQVSIAILLAQWVYNLIVAMPTDLMGWVNSFAPIGFAVARLVYQPSMWEQDNG